MIGRRNDRTPIIEDDFLVEGTDETVAVGFRIFSSVLVIDRSAGHCVEPGKCRRAFWRGSMRATSRVRCRCLHGHMRLQG
jgi:hypothetical protein